MGKSASPPPRIVAISPDDGEPIDLRNPAAAAALSWLVPGLGQLYQGRRTKGGLFMGSLLIALFVGLWLGEGRVVYASWRGGESRLAFLGQAGIGLVAVPAMLQSWRLGGPAREPFLGSSWFAPPLQEGQYVSAAYAEKLVRSDAGIDRSAFLDRPPLRQCSIDQLSLWHQRLGRWFDIGTLYTVIAGLLNLLVVYDAWAGPLKEQRAADDQAGKTQGGGRAHGHRPP